MVSPRTRPTPQAVARIYEAKGRPSFNPLIVHVIDLAAAERIGDFDEAARGLAEQHWPGPLTLVVPLREGSGIASIVTAGLATIGLGCPAHPAMQALLRAVGTAARRALGQRQRVDQPDAGRACAQEPRRADSVDHRRRANRARARIDHRRRDRRAAPAASTRPDRGRCRTGRSGTDRSAGPARQPLRAVEAAPARRIVARDRRISDRVRRGCGRREPQPVRRPGRGSRATVRPASPGRRVGQAAHRRRARAGRRASAARSTIDCDEPPPRRSLPRS